MGERKLESYEGADSNRLYRDCFKVIATTKELQATNSKGLLVAGFYSSIYLAALAGIFFIPVNEEMIYLSYGLKTVLAVLAGLCLVTFQGISHDCGHQAFFKSKFLNNFFGTVFGLPLLVSFRAWTDDHLAHHGKTNVIEEDPNCVFMYTEEGMEKVQKRLKNPLYFLYFWFFSIMAAIQMGLVASHLFGPPLGKGTTLYWSKQRALLSLANLVLIAGFVGTVVYFAPMEFLIFGFLIPNLVFQKLFLMVGYLEHNQGPAKYYVKGQGNFLKGALESNNFDYGFIFNSFFAGLGIRHLEHHLFPNIPFYNLNKVQDHLTEEFREEIKDKIEPRRISLFREFYGDYSKNYTLVPAKDGDHYEKVYRFGEHKHYLFFLVTAVLFPLVLAAKIMAARRAES